MRQIDLKEYQASEPHTLSVIERDLLNEALPSVNIAPVQGTVESYCLTPGPTVGALETGDLSVAIQPKIGIPQLLSLACYAIGKVKFRREDFEFPEESALPDVLALALASHARRAFARGLLHGYRVEDEALHTVRGRIKFDEQIRRRFGIPLPVEVQYDDFTDDILVNQLVKAAAHRLIRMRIRSLKARIGLGWIAGMLDNVSAVEFTPNNVPTVTFNRLNEHYRSAVELSRLILRHSEFETSRGATHAPGFLIDMNVLFQEFVTVSLQEALGVSERSFGERNIPSLDTHGRVALRPDLVWRDGSFYAFVGDAKYKNIAEKAVPESDIYQMLAYITALNLQGGMLIYAKGEADAATYHVRHADKTIEVVSLDIEGPLEGILKSVRNLACKIKALRREP